MKFSDSMMYSAFARLCACGLYSAMSLHILLLTGMCDRLSKLSLDKSGRKNVVFHCAYLVSDLNVISD